MDWRLLPENRVIAEGLDAVSALFPFYSEFLEVFKKVEEKIREKYERSLKPTREEENENEVCSSDSEEKEDTSENAFETKHESDNEVQRDDSNTTKKAAENFDNNQTASISGDYEDAIKPVSSFINGQSSEPIASECSNDACKLNKIEQQTEQFKSVLHSDYQSKLKHLHAEYTNNVDGESISRQESAHRKQRENNYTASEEWNGDCVLSSERKTCSPPKTELDRDNVLSSNSKSEHAVIENDQGETGELNESVENKISLDGVTTRDGSGSEGLTADCHDLNEDEDGDADPESGRLGSKKDTQENDDDKEDEDITDSDDESSESEKLRWSYLFNFRTMVHCVSGKNLGRASRWNAKVLRHHPTNFIALRNKVNLYMMLSLSMGQSFVSPALEALERLEEVAKERREMLMAKAEVAAIYERIATSAADVFNHSVPLYEEVLQEIDHLSEVTSSDSTFRDLVALWKRDLVEVYLELMEATKTVLEKHGHTQSTVFSRIKDILQSVVNDEVVTKNIRAQASIELGDAFISYLGNSTKEERNRQFHEDINIDQCFRQARLLDPEDTDILLRSARQQRLSAKTSDELKEVIELLDRCVFKLTSKRGEQKDVALHHLGLACRSLWLLTGSHTTPQMRIYFRSSGLRDANGFSPPVGCLVIKPPKTQFESVLVPRPYKNPPKHILMQGSNPIAREDDPNLLKARESFLEADLLTADGSGCLYPVEVARTYISTGDTKKAQEYLEKAHQRKFIGQNGVYLYEQMGIFEESTLTDDWNAAKYEIHIEKIKSIYREAIRYDTRGTRKAIMAFYRLLDILYGQIHTKEADLIVQTEYFLLYMTVQQTEKPNEMVKTMTNDDIKIGLMWRLIEMFHKRNDPHDAAAAFTYLSIINSAKKLTEDVKDVSLTTSEKQRLLLESTERVALERTVQPRYIPQTYQWLCYLDDMEKENRSSYSKPFGILLDMKKSAELKTVTGILRKQLEIKSLEIIRVGELSDVHSKEGLERVLHVLRKCVSIVVITSKDSPETQRLFSIVEAFCSGSSCNRRRICQAVFADVEDTELISEVPTWYIDRDNVPWGENKEKEVSQACRLLRTLFVRQE